MGNCSSMGNNQESEQGGKPGNAEEKRSEAAQNEDVSDDAMGQREGDDGDPNGDPNGMDRFEKVRGCGGN